LNKEALQILLHTILYYGLGWVLLESDEKEKLDPFRRQKLSFRILTKESLFSSGLRTSIFLMRMGKQSHLIQCGMVLTFPAFHINVSYIMCGTGVC